MRDVIGDLHRCLGDQVTEEEVKTILGSYRKSGAAEFSEDEIERIESTLLRPLEELRVALVVVDFQNDFVSGSLSVKNGDAGEDPLAALPIINDLLERKEYAIVVYTQDWHPNNHISFYEHARNEDRELSPDDKARKLRPFDIVRFDRPDTIQVLYPGHCVQGSWGSQLHPDMNIVDGAKFVKKGNQVFVDSYSAFSDNHGVKKSELESVLRSSGANVVICCGLAYDICVMHTLKDAARLNFLSAIIVDASKGLSEEKISEANDLFHSKGIALLSSSDVTAVLEKRKFPIEWVRILAAKANRS